MMEFRMAAAAELPELNSMFKTLVKDMDAKGINIWDEVYPCCCFDEDIREGRLYVLSDDKALVAAISICDSIEGEKSIEWSEPETKAVYLCRFGVKIQYQRMGIGELMMKHIIKLSKARAEYLRFIVADINAPAIRLYERLGFKRATGIHILNLEDGRTLYGYGYEMKLN